MLQQRNETFAVIMFTDVLPDVLPIIHNQVKISFEIYCITLTGAEMFSPLFVISVLKQIFFYCKLLLSTNITYTSS